MLLLEARFCSLYNTTASSRNTTMPLNPAQTHSPDQSFTTSYQLESPTSVDMPRSVLTSDLRSYSPLSHLNAGLTSLSATRSPE